MSLPCWCTWSLDHIRLRPELRTHQYLQFKSYINNFFLLVGTNNSLHSIQQWEILHLQYLYYAKYTKMENKKEYIHIYSCSSSLLSDRRNSQHVATLWKEVRRLSILPVQFLPSLPYPLRQRQTLVPSVLVHVAFEWQPFVVKYGVLKNER